jgi:hypothetical protein
MVGQIGLIAALLVARAAEAAAGTTSLAIAMVWGSPAVPEHGFDS